MTVDSFTNALEDLDPISRALVELSLRRGMDDAEIAQILGSDEESVTRQREDVLRQVATRVAPEAVADELPELEAAVAGAAGAGGAEAEAEAEPQDETEAEPELEAEAEAEPQDEPEAEPEPEAEAEPQDEPEERPKRLDPELAGLAALSDELAGRNAEPEPDPE
ncbi:MAG: hypothetical protein QOJ07_631, partial [Thermoleophilaceae bacterium]|nr:hypothetical protein [Thermoleophilaceae bacterium]